MNYDAARAPDAAAWLEIDEADRLHAVQAWLEAAGVTGHEDEIERCAALLATLETQVAGEDPPVVAATLERLMVEGLTRGHALFAMAGVLDQTIRRMLGEESEFDPADYARRMGALTAEGILDQPDGETGHDETRPFDPDHQALLETFAEAHADQGVAPFPTMAGFLFSVVCAPGVLPPSAWLPQLLGKVKFDSNERAEDITAALMALNNWVAETVWSPDGDPLPADCRPDADALANLTEGSRFGQWCEGFARAQVSFEDLWLSAIGGDEEQNLRLSQLFMNLSFFASEELARELHAEISEGGQAIALEDLAEDLCADVPQVLAAYIELGRELREKLSRRPAPSPARSIKVGRNEACPCGSGKKYKKCCGASIR